MRRLAWGSLLLACTEANPNASTSASSSGETGSDASSTDSADVTGTSTSDDAADDVEPETGNDGCPTGHLCVASPPPGWSGPAIVFEDTPDQGLPECAEDYPEMVAQAYRDLQAPPAECTCTCADPPDAGCTEWVLERHDQAACPAAVEEFPLLGLCLNAPSEPAGDFWRAAPGSLSAGPCEASGAMELDPPTFGTRTTICGAIDPPVASCGSDLVCMPLAPEGFESALCVWQLGELECPTEGGFTVRRVAYGSAADDRACETCTCGDPTGGCTLDLVLHPTSCADDSTTILPTDGTCMAVDHPVESVHGDDTSLVVDASCAPSAGQPIGDVVGEGPMTICCAG